MATVTAPVKGFTGVVAGVSFFDGKADTTNTTALAYFRRQGYLIDHGPASPAAAEPSTAPQSASMLVLPSKPKVGDLRKYAEAKGIDLAGATRKDDILAAIEAAERPADGAGSGDKGEGDPAAPAVTEVTVTPGDGVVTVDWVADGEAVSFEVESVEVDNDDDPEVDPCAAGAGFEVLDLDNGVEYRFRVRAVTETGAGPWSEAVTATPQGGE